MTDPTPAPDVAALRALCDAATPGPWEFYCSGDAQPHRVFLGRELGFLKVPHFGYDDPNKAKSKAQYHNAQFIAAARTALPQLLDRVDVLEGDTLTRVRVFRDWAAKCGVTVRETEDNPTMICLAIAERAKTLESRLARLTAAGRNALNVGHGALDAIEDHTGRPLTNPALRQALDRFAAALEEP